MEPRTAGAQGKIPMKQGMSRVLLWAACATILSAVTASASTVAERAFEKLRTAPPLCPDQFDFVVCGDSRSTDPVVLPEDFYTMIREWNTLKPALIVNSGDLILGGPVGELDAMWTEFEKAVGGCSAPLFPVAGNHDINKDPAVIQIYEDRIGPLTYAFSYGNSRFIVLNSEAASESGRLSDVQVAWLKEDLSSTRATNIFLFLHQPFFALDWEANWGNAAEAIQGHPVKAVFAGHEHMYRDYGVRDGVHYVISGGGGAESSSPETEGGFHHYLWVRVRGGQVEWSVIKPGAIFPADTVTQAKVEAARKLSEMLRTEAVEVPWGSAMDRQVSVYLDNPGQETISSKLTWTVPAPWHVDPKEMPVAAAAGTSALSVFHVWVEAPVQACFPAPTVFTTIPMAGFAEPIALRQAINLVPLVTAPNTGAPVVCDGELSEWVRAPRLDLTYATGYDLKNTDDLQANARMMWDEGHLYMAVEVEDNEFCQPYSGDIVWSADSVELWMDDSVWSFSLTSRGPEVFVDCIGAREVESLVPAVTLAVKHEGRKCVYEAAFPASELPFISLKSDGGFRCSMVVNDLDPSGPVKVRHALELSPGAGSHFQCPKVKVLFAK